MKPPIIADSSGLIALISEDDTNHKLAIKVSKELSDLSTFVIVPGDVFSETLNVIGKKFSHRLAVDVSKEITDSSTYTIIETDALLRENALILFSKQAESVSFTDCAVMAFADKFNTKDIFGFDKTFKVNGYHRLGFE